MKIAVAALALVLFAQDEKFTLKFAPKQGDKISRAKKMELKLSLEVAQGDQGQEIEIEQRETEKMVTEYAGVEAGKVTRKILDCIEDYQEAKQGEGMEWRRTDQAMHGRKVTLSLKDGQLVREGADGMTEKHLNKLTLEEKSALIFPKDPVKVGDSWEIKGDEVAAFLETDQKVKKATMKLKLASVKEIDKRRCAVITTTIDLVVEAENEIEITATIEGEGTVWIERGYLLDFKGKGKLTMKSESDQFSVSGKGDITMETKAKIE